MANQNHKKDGAPPSNIHIGTATEKKSWLVWLFLVLGVIAVLFGLKRCSHDNAAAVVIATPAAKLVAPLTPTIPAPAAASATGTAVILDGTSGIVSYLGGTEAVPRTFVFEKLNFDTAKSDIRAADHEELNALATSMKKYPKSRIRIVGYADARGAASANAILGKQRAESVKAALVAGGIDVARLETASGGETDPVATNVTSSGQAENRRTELIVLQR